MTTAAAVAMQPKFAVHESNGRFYVVVLEGDGTPFMILRETESATRAECESMITGPNAHVHPVMRGILNLFLRTTRT